MCVTCCGRTDLHLSIAGSGGSTAIGGTAGAGGALAAKAASSTGGATDGMKNTGGVFSTGGSEKQGSLPETGISGTGGTGGQIVNISQLPADVVPVCTYAESGPDHTITVYRDVASTSYYFVSNSLGRIIERPIGTPDARVLVEFVYTCEYLYVQILSNGLIQLVDDTNHFDEECRSRGPSSSFSSTCSKDGVQITQMFKDATGYVIFNRPDGLVYYGEIDGLWDSGWTPGNPVVNSVVNYFTAAPGTTIRSLLFSPVYITPLGAQTVTFALNPDNNTEAIYFTDLDNRLVTISLTPYSVILDISATQPQ